jgi:hypothetical protein
MWSATTPGTAEPTSLLLKRLIEQNSVLRHKRLHIIQIKSTLLTSGLNHDNVMLAPEFGAFGIFIEVVNLIV